jgi:hypothetical protein
MVTNTNFALSRTTAADGLHMYKQGKYGKQWLPKLLVWMTKSQKEKMDAMYVYLLKVPSVGGTNAATGFKTSLATLV